MAKTKRKTAKKAGGVSKLSAVRQTIEKLGPNAMPAQILESVKQEFGVEMSPSMVSNYKSMVLKKAPGKSTTPRKLKAKPASTTNGKGSFSLEDIQAVKDLADRIGVDQLRSLSTILS